MTQYAVIRCKNLHCGRFTYCKATQKTKKCPYCGKRIPVITQYEVIVDTTAQAKKLVQEFNRSLGELNEPSWYKK